MNRVNLEDKASNLMMRVEKLRPVWWRFIIILWVGLIIINWVLFILPQTSFWGRYDFTAYANAGQAIYDGLSPYDFNMSSRHLYLYPPLLAQLLAPFMGIFGEPATATLWFIINIVCLIGIILIMRQHTAPQNHIWLWIMPLPFIPLTHTIYMGQVTVILMFLLMLTWHDYHRGNYFRAGIWIAIAGWIKVFPAFLVVYFILRRDWRVVAGVGIAGIGLGIIQILISGMDMMIDAFNVIFRLFADGQNNILYLNSSIAGFTARMFTEHPMIIPITVNETLFNISRYGLLLFTILITYSIVVWRGRDNQDNFDFGFSATLMMSLLFGYTLWISGLTLYILPLWIAFRSSKGNTIWLLLVVFVTLCVYFPIAIVLDRARVPWWSTFSMGFYASYTLWGLLIYKLARR